jgi:hypothetical protein
MKISADNSVFCGEGVDRGGLTASAICKRDIEPEREERQKEGEDDEKDRERRRERGREGEMV